MAYTEVIISLAIFLQAIVLIQVALLSRIPCSRPVWYTLFITCALMLTRRVIDYFYPPFPLPIPNEIIAMAISASLLWVVTKIRRLMYTVIQSESENRLLTETLEARIVERTKQLETVFSKMQKAKKQWERTFDAVPDLIMLLDTDFNIVRVNRAAANALGKEPSEIIGKKCYKLVHNQYEPPKFCPHLQLKKDGYSHTAHAHIKNFSGDFLITVHPLTTKAGKVVGTVHIARDISELIKIQNQLREKSEKVLKLENAKTRDLLDVARSLNAGIAHELRTPMQSIMNTIELINEWVRGAAGKDDEEVWTETLSLSDISDLLSDAETRVLYSISVLESLSSYTKAGARKETHLINVVPEIRTVMRTLRITDRFKCLSEDDFVLVGVEKDCLIRINSSDFMQLVINLCVNALEAITHTDPKIMISVELVNGLVEIHIVDNGNGVDPELGDKIFIPYVSTKGDGKSNYGLGLSIVKNLVTQYGGEISYKSVSGHTDFWLSFPCAKGEKAE